MEKYLIGYKQGNGEYVYVDKISKSNIVVTLDFNEAMNFMSKEIAIVLTGLLNLMDSEKDYLPLKVELNITELSKGGILDVITN